jgi:hypothetical protein
MAPSLWQFYSSAAGWVSTPFVLVPPNVVFGRFDRAALRGCHTLNVCLFVYELQ